MGVQDNRQYTLEERLADERILFLWGEINLSLAGNIIMRMLEMQAKDAMREITLYINSPGGYVDDTMALYDTMQFVACPVKTVVVGQACSGAAIILAAGTKGKRLALPNSKIMLHQPLGGVTGQASDIKIQAEEIIKNKRRLNMIVAKHTGKPENEVTKCLERDYYMTPDEAKEFGVIDSIITGGVK